ncbi:cobalamin biosynthesis protein [Salipiger mucosus]|nr:cobalamin biosynthesis protein [Salipiger mucosus]
MIVAGLGFRRAAGPDSLRDALARALGDRAVNALATAEDKAEAAALAALARALGLPLVGVPPEALAVQPTLTRSEASFAARGTGSLAEAAALAAAGPGARLIAPRCLSQDRMASCALAEGETT